MNKKAAQSASCLKDRDFKKVYDTLRAIVDENKRASNATYEGLHKNFNSGIKFDSLREFIVEVESEVVIRTGHGPESNLTRCVVYFWVLNCVKVDIHHLCLYQFSDSPLAYSTSWDRSFRPTI